MKRGFLSFLAAGILLPLVGCETNVNFRSANFSGDKLYKKGAPPVSHLKENEVLGLGDTRAIKDADIERVLDEAASLRLAEGSTIFLVQSGAAHPDKEMIEALSKHFVVVPHSGLPSDLRSGPDEDISRKLRLAAAHSKAETLLVYWGHLEVKRDDLPTSLVSWVPVVDFTVPDEYQRMRMHLKAALIDVRTGNWATFRTESIESDALTTRFAREHEQKWPLQNTKQRLYKNSVQRILDSYVLARN